MQCVLAGLLLVGLAASIDMSAEDKEVLDKTVWLEARGEPKEGQMAVVSVIKNRAEANRGYWGGNSIKGVCLAPQQFEAWNNQKPGDVHPENDADAAVYKDIQGWSKSVVDGSEQDRSQGAVYYNNPDKEGPLTDRIKGICPTVVIGAHHFYKEC